MTKFRFPSVNDFCRVDAARLRGMYDALFARIQEKESAYRIFGSVPPQIPRVLKEVDALLAIYPDAEKRPPLFGVPVGVKGILRTAGYPMRCGSLLPADLFAGPEAAVVSALRKAGCIVIGNTATSEFASAEPAATCNPHNPDHTPGGSSSGSAAGVAAGFFPLAIGTQTHGSIIRPASYCGVTGFKPSHGLLSTKGVIYVSRSVDSVGLFTVTPGEMETVFYALAPEREKAPVPETIRIGVPVGPYLDQAHPDTLARFGAVLDAYKAHEGLSVEVVAVPCFADLAALVQRHMDLVAVEFAEEHAGWFPRFEAMYRTRTKEVIRYGRTLGPSAMDEGRASRKKLREELGVLMRDHGLHVWASPAALGEADKSLLTTGDPCMNIPWSHAGMPALTIPAGRGPQGLPLGLQLVGAFDDDDTLLAVGKALFAATPAV